ncbi:glycosyl transferase [uncultured Amnibacterium sp.]|uniref:glycosyl transferase n=1 Tax=uncultured Amnibacterium sp. TaxID=1631851 RepID=UPI0035CC22FE
MTSLQAAAPRHRHPVPPLRIALLGARGHAATELTVAEVGRRLELGGHEVVVGETGGGNQAVRRAATAGRFVLRRFDVALLLDPADIAIAPLIRSRGAAVAVRIDGRLHEQLAATRRGRAVEHRAAREADAVVVDAVGIQDHYADEYALQTDLIGYGARIVRHVPTDLLEGLGIVPRHFHLVVVGSEPEAHLDEVVEGYHRSAARLPLVLAATTPLPMPALARVRALAGRDSRIRLLDGVPDDRLLDQLHAHASGSIHGSTIGAADPTLLRAMGAGAAVVAWDTTRNREIAGTAGSYFASPGDAARRIEEIERYPFRFRDIGELMQERARRFDWDVVGEQYQALAAKLARGYSTRGLAYRRRGAPVAVPAEVALEGRRD